jgi:septum site-determining protein MinC
MLNNIKISQKSEEIVLNINIIAEMSEIVEELQVKLPKLKEFYKTSTIPMRITGKLFSETEIETLKNLIQNEIKVEVKFDDVSDLLGLHAIKKTFQANTEISETKYITNSIRSGQIEEYPGSIVICGDVNAGGEVVAGGNVIVVGALRGVAHAGANGNMLAMISANSIDVTQIRIGNLVKEIEEKIDKNPVCKVFGNEISID